MDDFDPKAYLAKADTPAPAPAEEFDPKAYLAKGDTSTASEEFDPKAYLAASAPSAAPTTPAAPADTKTEYLKQTNQVNPEEVEGIAKKYGVDADKMKSLMPYLGATVNEPDRPIVGPQEAKAAAGIVSRGLFNIPMGLYRFSQEEPTRRAMDEMRELALSRQTGVVKAAQLTGELGVGGVAFGAAHNIAGAINPLGAATAETGLAQATKAARITRGIAEGAAFGTVGGLFNAKEGEVGASTAEGAVAGAALGAALPVAADGLKAALSASGKAVKGIVRIMGPAADAEATHVTRQVEAEMGARAETIQRSEDLAVRVAKEDENPVTAGLLDKKAVQQTVDTLNKDDTRLAAAWEANPDLAMQQEARGWTDEQYIDQLARRSLRSQDTSDVVQFANYIKTKGAPPVPRTASELEKMQSVDSVSDARAVLKDFQAKVSEPFYRREFQAFKASTIAAELNADFVDAGGGYVSNPVSRLGRMFLDGAGYGAQVDNRSGSTLEMVLHKLGVAKNGQLKDIGNTLHAGADVRAAVNSTGIRNMPIAQLEQIESTGSLASLNPEQQAAFKDWSEFQTAQMQHANELGVPITQIDPTKAAVYIPKMQVDEASTIIRLQKRMDAVEKVVPGISFDRGITPDQFVVLEAKAPDAYQDLKKGLEWVSGQAIETANDLTRMAKQSVNLQGLMDLASSRTARSMAGALQQRAEEGLPSFLRETDLNKLQVRWANSTFKDAYLRDGIQQLIKNRNMLMAVGDSAGAEYVSNMLADIQGTRKSPAAWVTKQLNKKVAEFSAMADKAEEGGNKVAASVLRTLADNPDLPGVISSSMYTNLIGLNPHTFVLNVTQPLLMTLPELSTGGAGWAAGKVMKGYFRLLDNMVTGGPDGLNVVAREGYMAPTFRAAEMIDSFHSGLERGWLGTASRSALETASHVGMSLLKMSETVNRAVTYNMAEGIATDLIQKSSSAERWLAHVGRGSAYEMQKMVNTGDAKALEKLVADYLVGKTMFHYNRVAMNELGRYLGPIFSSFTKWPTSVAAIMASDIARKGMAGGTVDAARKLIGPLFGLMALDHYVLRSHGITPEDSPRARVLLGKEGLASLSPIGSLKDTAKNFMQPPVVSAAFKGFASLLTGDPANWWKWTNATAETFIPGAGFVRILDTTLPGLAGKERPEKGTTLTGRALNLVKHGLGTRLDDTIQEKVGLRK